MSKNTRDSAHQLPT